MAAPRADAMRCNTYGMRVEFETLVISRCHIYAYKKKGIVLTHMTKQPSPHPHKYNCAVLWPVPQYRGTVLYWYSFASVSSKGTMESPRGTQARLGSRLVEFHHARRRAAPLCRARKFPRSPHRTHHARTNKHGTALRKDWSGFASRLEIRGADPDLR